MGRGEKVEIMINWLGNIFFGGGGWGMGKEVEIMIDWVLDFFEGEGKSSQESTCFLKDQSNLNFGKSKADTFL